MAFLGIPVPAAVRPRFQELPCSGEREQPGAYHITMAYLGKGVPIADVCSAIRVVEPIFARMDPFKVRATKLDCFSPDEDGTYPIIARIESDELQDLRSRLCRAFDKENVFFSKKHPEFKPHVTLAYSKEPGVTEALKTPIEWEVNEATLWGGDSKTERMIVKFAIPASRSLKYENRLSRLVAQARSVL